MAIDLDAVAPKLTEFINLKAQVVALQQKKQAELVILAKINDDLAAVQTALAKVTQDLRAAGL